MIKQPTKEQIATFFDVVLILADHENKEFSRTGVTIFPGLPRPIPEVKICLDWLYQLKMGYDEFKQDPAPTPPPLPKTVEVKKSGAKKGTVPWNKGGKKVVKQVVKKEQQKIVEPKIPTPEELPPTVLKPGPQFEYANEVAGQVLIIPDDPDVLSNPK